MTSWHSLRLRSVVCFPTPVVSRATVYSSVLVGVAFMAVRYLQTVVQRARGRRLPLFPLPGGAAAQAVGSGSR